MPYTPEQMGLVVQQAQAKIQAAPKYQNMLAEVLLRVRNQQDTICAAGGPAKTPFKILIKNDKMLLSMVRGALTKYKLDAHEVGQAESGNLVYSIERI
jgi:hypothetical protein